MLFWQSSVNIHGRLEIRLVDHYHNSGEGLEHYVNYIDSWVLEHGVTIQWTVCPHDIQVRELGTGMTRRKRLQELGVRRIKILKKDPINDGIEAVRRMLQHLWIDPTECDYTIKGFKNYSKEWDDRIQVWKDKPLHDEWSHPMDMVRYRAMQRKDYYDKVDGQKKSRVLNVGFHQSQKG